MICWLILISDVYIFKFMWCINACLTHYNENWFVNHNHMVVYDFLIESFLYTYIVMWYHILLQHRMKIIVRSTLYCNTTLYSWFKWTILQNKILTLWGKIHFGHIKRNKNIRATNRYFSFKRSHYMHADILIRYY